MAILTTMAVSALTQRNTKQTPSLGLTLSLKGYVFKVTLDSIGEGDTNC